MPGSDMSYRKRKLKVGQALGVAHVDSYDVFNFAALYESGQLQRAFVVPVAFSGAKNAGLLLRKLRYQRFCSNWRSPFS